MRKILNKSEKRVRNGDNTISPQNTTSEVPSFSISANPANGEVLKYNGTNEKWENGEIETVESLSELSDVSISDTPTNGEVLKYNSTSEKWENGEIETAGSLSELSDVSLSSPELGDLLYYRGDDWFNTQFPEVFINRNEDKKVVTADGVATSYEFDFTNFEDGHVGSNNGRIGYIFDFNMKAGSASDALRIDVSYDGENYVQNVGYISNAITADSELNSKLILMKFWNFYIPIVCSPSAIGNMTLMLASLSSSPFTRNIRKIRIRTVNPIPADSIMTGYIVRYGTFPQDSE